ncbi:hypothetical protein JCM9279_006226 [Rhodotorula babjevae]
MPAPLPARFFSEPYPRRADRRLALRLARKARKAAKAERLNDARIKASLKKAGKKELAAKVALTRLASSDASTSPAPLARKRKADEGQDDSERVANVAYDVAESFKKRQIVSLRKMELSLEQRSSLISSSVLAALTSSTSTAKKADVARGDLELKRKAFRSRKALALARTGNKVDDAVAKVDDALDKVLTSLMNDAVETALKATLLDLSRRATPSTVANANGNEPTAAWWSDDAKTMVAGLEAAGPLSSSARKTADQDLDAPKPRNRSLFQGKTFASSSTSIFGSSSATFKAAAAVGPAFSTQRSLTLEPTSFAVFLESSAIATLRTTSTTITKPTMLEAALAKGANKVEAAPALEPLLVKAKPLRTEDAEVRQCASLAKLFKLVDGKWVCLGKGKVLLNEAKAVNEDGKKPSWLVFRASSSQRVRFNVALFKGFKIEFGVRGGNWVRFSAIEGSSTASYLMRLADGRLSFKLVHMAATKAKAL